MYLAAELLNLHVGLQIGPSGESYTHSNLSTRDIKNVIAQPSHYREVGGLSTH